MRTPVTNVMLWDIEEYKTQCTKIYRFKMKKNKCSAVFVSFFM